MRLSLHSRKFWREPRVDQVQYANLFHACNRGEMQKNASFKYNMGARWTFPLHFCQTVLNLRKSKQEVLFWAENKRTESCSTTLSNRQELVGCKINVLIFCSRTQWIKGWGTFKHFTWPPASTKDPGIVSERHSFFLVLFCSGASRVIAWITCPH